MTRKDREQAISQLGAHGVSYSDARKLLRYGMTLNRLAEAQCNGDWPADNGERKVKACAKCESLWAPSVITKGGWCVECRTVAAAEGLVNSLLGATALIQGDPRGCVFGVSFRDGTIVCLG